jgi:hypothetical protein
VAAVLGALAALGVVTAAARTARLRFLAVVVGAAVLVTMFALQSAGAPVVALLPWLAVVTAYLYFVSHSLRTMGGWGRQVRARLSEMLAPVACLTIGRETWSALTAQERGNG